MHINYPDLTTWANQVSWFALFYKVDFGLIVNLILFVVFMFSCYFVAKWFSERNGLSSVGKGGKIVERIFLSPQSSIIVVEMQGVFYLLSVDKTGTRLIDKRTDWIVQSVQPSISKIKFDTILDRYITKNKR